MTREEMEELIRTVSIEVMKELAQRSNGAPVKPRESACECGGQCCSKASSESVKVPDESSRRFSGRVLTVAGIDAWADDGGGVLRLERGTIVTPLARDRASELGIELQKTTEPRDPGNKGSQPIAPPIQCPTNTIAFFSTRNSLSHEKIVTSAAEAAGFEVHCCAAGDRDGGAARALSCARLVSDGKCCRGVILTDEAYSVQRQANRLAGVRADVCGDVEQARRIRNSETNLLLLSDGQLGMKMLERIVEIWLRR